MSESIETGEKGEKGAPGETGASGTSGTGAGAGRTLRTRREIVLGSLLLTAAGVTAARMPNQPLNYLGDNKLEKIVPETIGRWKFVSSSGLVLPTEDKLAL